MALIESEITSTTLKATFSNGEKVAYRKVDMVSLILQKGSIKEAINSTKVALKEKLGNFINPDDFKIDFAMDGTPTKLEWENR